MRIEHNYIEAQLDSPIELTDLIQLQAVVVEQRLPPWANYDDMYRALLVSGMTVQEIFEEYDRTTGGKVINEPASAQVMELILMERFWRRLDEIAGHKRLIRW